MVVRCGDMGNILWYFYEISVFLWVCVSSDFHWHVSNGISSSPPPLLFPYIPPNLFSWLFDLWWLRYFSPLDEEGRLEESQGKGYHFSSWNKALKKSVEFRPFFQRWFWIYFTMIMLPSPCQRYQNSFPRSSPWMPGRVPEGTGNKSVGVCLWLQPPGVAHSQFIKIIICIPTS